MLCAASLTHQAATPAWSLPSRFPDKPKRWRIRPICAGASGFPVLLSLPTPPPQQWPSAGVLKPSLPHLAGIPPFERLWPWPRPTQDDRSCDRFQPPRTQRRSQPPARRPWLPPWPVALQDPNRNFPDDRYRPCSRRANERVSASDPTKTSCIQPAAPRTYGGLNLQRRFSNPDSLALLQVDSKPPSCLSKCSVNRRLHPHRNQALVKARAVFFNKQTAY